MIINFPIIIEFLVNNQKTEIISIEKYHSKSFMKHMLLGVVNYLITTLFIILNKY